MMFDPWQSKRKAVADLLINISKSTQPTVGQSGRVCKNLSASAATSQLSDPQGSNLRTSLPGLNRYDARPEGKLQSSPKTFMYHATREKTPRDEVYETHTSSIQTRDINVRVIL